MNERGSFPRTRLDRFASALSFQSLFYRESRVDIRCGREVVVSPCRSKVTQIAHIGADGRVAEKKWFGGQRFFSLGDLAEREEALHLFEGGLYVNLYLSPWDYHSLIFPASGRVTSSFFKDGFNWPVVTWGGAWLRNAKLVAVIGTALGFPLGLIMVGSWNVGGLEPLFESGRSYERGDRFGRFRIGSTVVLLFPRDTVSILCHEGQKLELGAPVARISNG